MPALRLEFGMADELRVPFLEMVERLTGILRGCGMVEERAALCGRMFAEASRDGVASHGVNRFVGFVEGIRMGRILANVKRELVGGFGGLERWDGKDGPGIWNAWESMGRAVTLAGEFGIGCVGLANTNHWMRAGNYGWQAAEAGCVGICWTNTIPLMAAWGGREKVVGNNPLVIAVPREGREHMVLDMAMSQYSMGKLGILRKAGEAAEFVAGFDAKGEMTRDAGAVMDGGSAMPIGYWKGSGLAMMLDVVAAAVSGGLTTGEVGREPWERRVSQVFVAMDVRKVGVDVGAVAERVVLDLKGRGEEVRYPGEGAMRARRESMERGVRVDGEVWGEVLGMG